MLISAFGFARSSSVRSRTRGWSMSITSQTDARGKATTGASDPGLLAARNADQVRLRTRVLDESQSRMEEKRTVWVSFFRLPVSTGLLHHRQRGLPGLSVRVSAQTSVQQNLQPPALPTNPQVIAEPSQGAVLPLLCLLTVCDDCLKGWRSSTHHSCGNPQSVLEPLCSGNTGSVVRGLAEVVCL